MLTFFSLTIAFSFILAYITTHIKIFKMSQIIFSKIFFSLSITNLSFLISLVIIFLAVWAFSFMYMGSKANPYFNIIFLLFVLSMVIFILVEDFFILFLGWDGLGIVSFLLIIFYSNISSMKSAVITIISNRVGDIMMISTLAMFFFYNFNMQLASFTSSISFAVLVLILALILSKSAQFPFMDWLPKAMAAPTPVSALVHSSTLVTAGIFLSFKILQNMTVPFTFLTIMGLLTLLFSSLGAIVESDFKKLIALSTLSQLSLMTISLSLNLLSLTYSHMIIHAFFKASLFMIIGIFMLTNFSEQMTQFFTLKTMNLQLKSFLLFNILSLMGMFFLSAFYSKDFLLKSIFSNTSIFLFLIFVLGCYCTVIYSMRFFKEFNNKFQTHSTGQVNSSIKTHFMNFSLLAMSVVSGFLLNYNSFLFFNTMISFKLLDIMIFFTIPLSFSTFYKLDFKKFFNTLSLNKIFAYKIALNMTFSVLKNIWNSMENFWVEKLVSSEFPTKNLYLESKKLNFNTLFKQSLVFLAIFMLLNSLLM
uniref:NADH:ubiquinone reductase (H(+)-translocating) n=1 Tax=Gnathostomula paradoxa TaxID=66783 RepID=A0A0F6Q2V2_9BILA|nr:NADH dehydrogenase subunit 5 [Gnathostomula paradoxa]AKD00037.1 NADH dehydrogenase subunit 5 [Gnathostomula paradoxa]